MIDVKDLVDNWTSSGMSGKTFAQLDRIYRYGEFAEAVRNSGRFLRSRGLVQGDRLIVSSGQPYPIAVAFWACLLEGITAVLLDPAIGPKRAHELIRITDSKFLIMDREVGTKWAVTDLAVPWLETGTQRPKKSKLLGKLLRKKVEHPESGVPDFWRNAMTFAEEQFPAQRVDREAIAYILFTSGSTAVPKAVQVSYRALWSNLATVQRVYGLDENSRILNILTPYHTDGIIQGPVLSALTGASWHHPFTFTVGRLPELFDSFYKYQISHFITVPTMLKLMHDLGERYRESFAYPEFHAAITSAAPFELALWESFEEMFGIRVSNVYGLTETIAGASYCGPLDDTYQRGSIGVPLDCAFKIVDNEGEVRCPGTEGELLIKGDNVFSGYLNNPEATRAAFTEDGWFRTGDSATSDDDGFYYLRGRIKNLIISGGINIQPEEVTAVLNAHPDVAEAACLGMPDPTFGEISVAVVVLRSGANADAGILTDHCRSELEEIKVPRRIYFLESIEKTGSGKIKYATLKTALLNESMTATTLVEKVSGYRTAIVAAAVLAFKLPAERVDFERSSTLTLDGWDSLAHLAFITNLEETLSTRFSSKEIMQISSLTDAERILTKKNTR